MFGNIGPTELILILAIVLLLFGANKVPEVARSLGRGIRAFRAEAYKMRQELEAETKLEEEEEEEGKEKREKSKEKGKETIKEAELETNPKPPEQAK